MELPQGRELDALIAEKVMGLNVQHGPETSGGDGKPGNPMTVGSKPVYYDEPRGSVVRGFGKDIPPYSTDIRAANLVSNEMYNRKYVLRIESFGPFNPPVWKAAFGLNAITPEQWEDKNSIQLTESMAHAICLAALKALS